MYTISARKHVPIHFVFLQVFQIFFSDKVLRKVHMENSCLHRTKVYYYFCFSKTVYFFGQSVIDTPIYSLNFSPFRATAAASSQRRSTRARYRLHQQMTYYDVAVSCSTFSSVNEKRFSFRIIKPKIY